MVFSNLASLAESRCDIYSLDLDSLRKITELTNIEVATHFPL